MLDEREFGNDLVEGAHRRRGDVVLTTELDPEGRGACGQDGLDEAIQRTGMFHAQWRRGVARIAHQIVAPAFPEDVGVGALRIGKHRDPAVERGERTPFGGGDARVPGRPQCRLGNGPTSVLHQGERSDGIDHRYLDELPFTGAFTMEQRGKDRVHESEARHLVGDEVRGQRWPASLELHGVGHTRGGLDHIVVGRSVAMRRGRWPTVGLAHHDVGFHRRDGRVVEAEPGERRRAQVGDEHIARRSDAQEGVAASRVLQVEAHIALVAQQVERHTAEPTLGAGAHDAVGVATCIFDADHIGTEVAQDLGGVRPHHYRGEVEDAYTVQWALLGKFVHGTKSACPCGWRTE